MKGRIFTIEEFSTYDGPGIRTTVFLKGCPLRCMWCHNPEGQELESQIIRSNSGCLGCGACLAEGQKKLGVPCLVEESIEVCPRKLVRKCGNEFTVEELVSKLEKNIEILNMSGGGVTFSGGEPLAQWQFVHECMIALKGKTSCALQTCGYASDKAFSAVLAQCDYVLYDLKLMDSQAHLHYTGVDNQLILKNYRTLAESGKPFITRIPLIPTVNDTEENIRATASLMSELGVDKIELLPYNKMAGGKYYMVGKSYKVDFNEAVTPDPRKEIFREYGIEVKVL